jgi:hypothetical protein
MLDLPYSAFCITKNPVDAHEHLERVCQAIGLLLKDLAQGRCRGVISEKIFVDTVLKIEAEQVRKSETIT